jgi:threonine/homoserine efflux transporter RhtA
LTSLASLGLGALTANNGAVALLMGLYPAVAALLGAFLLGERLSPIETTGAVLALSAAKLLGVGSAA